MPIQAASNIKPDLPNLNLANNIYINISKGHADLEYLGWGVDGGN